MENCSRRHFYLFDFYLLKKMRLDVSCESSAGQKIRMKYRPIISEKQWKNIQDYRLMQSWLAP